MVTTVLADCPVCKKEVEAKILDCDNCYEIYLEKGGDPAAYSDLNCAHLECMTCEERLS